jgi:hypothetical protein
MPETEINYFLLCPEERNRLRLFEAPLDASEVIKSAIPNGNIKEVKQSYMGL